MRGELARLRNEKSQLAKPSDEASAPAESPEARPDTPKELPKDAWADAGFATPQAALRTRGWAVLNSNRDRFKESLFITDGARKAMEEMLERMIAAAPAADRQRFSRQILDNNLGLEDAMLFPMIAENQAKTYTGYRVLSEQSLADDELLLEVETRMTAAGARTENLKFKKIGDEWKVVIDEEFIKARMRSK